jgi:hypothetical protein
MLGPTLDASFTVHAICRGSQVAQEGRESADFHGFHYGSGQEHW